MSKKIADRDYEADIREIKEILKKIQEEELKEIREILKKMQEDVNRPENNFPYYSVNEYVPVANNYLPSTQACSEAQMGWSDALKGMNSNY